MGGTSICGLYRYVPHGFQAVYSGIGYINQSFFTKLRKRGIATQKYIFTTQPQQR